MSRERLHVGPSVRASGVTLVALERSRVSVQVARGRIVASAEKRAMGVVVIDARGARAYSPSGSPLDLEDLRSRVAGLREVLA